MAIYKEVLEKNYTVVGSPTITDGYVASGFSSSSYVQMSIPTLTQSFVHISKMFAPATVSTSGSYPGSFSVNGSDTNWGLQPNSSNFLTACNILQAGTDVNRRTFSNTWVWVAIEVTTTGAVMRTLQDSAGSTYTLDTLPPLSDSAWNIEIIYNTNLLSTFSNKTFYIGVNNYHSKSTANWQIDLKNTKFIADGVEWYAVKVTLVDVSGSVEISKGYYSDGPNKIIMPASTYNIDALTANQAIGGKNKLYAYKDSTDSVGALIASTTPTGSFKITKDLEHPVYLDPTKNYIAGGELIDPEVSFTQGTGPLWVRPNLTSNTSYGTVSDVYGDGDGLTYAPWKALDGSTSTYASLHDGSGGVFWWKWELPHDVVFKPNSILTFVQRNSSEGCAGWRFYADVEMTKPLGSPFSSSVSSGTSIRIPCSNLTSDIKTNIIYLYNSSVSSWPGMAELRFSNVYRVGDTEVSSTKALQYSEDQDKTYWIPSGETVSLSSVKAAQSVGPVNDVYLTTTTGTPTASLSFSDNGEITGAVTKFPLKQKVYLNNETDTILGVQERPDEIVISQKVTQNYTVTGSPAITNAFILTGLSSSNYLSRPTDTTFSPGSSAWEIKAKVTTGSSLGSEEVFIDPNSDQRGLRIGFQSHSGPKWQFLVSSGYGWINTSAYYGSHTVQPNTTYWIKAGYTGSQYYLEYSTDGSEYIRDVSYSSSSKIGSYALQIRSYSGFPWSGSVDLKETSITIGSEVWWKPVGISDGITVSEWSALYSDVTGYTGNTALDYTTPVDIPPSSLEIPAGVETAYLWYVNGDIKCKLPNAKVLDKAVFTGYALTLNNGTISGVVKRGELCAAFVQRGYGRNTRRYLFIPAVNLKDGSFTTRAGQGFYDMSVSGTLPPSEVGASMGNVEYDRISKTAIFEGATFDYIGNMMCRLVG